MRLKNYIALIFYALIGIGLTYWVFFNYNYWQSIQQRTNAELSSINNLFSSSVEAAFAHQETLLELLGQQLYNNDFFKDRKNATSLLDNVLAQNKSFVAFGLINPDGKVILGSSNVVLDKIENLNSSPNTKDSFALALSSQHIAIGRTYFLKPLNSMIIPLRKAIRDENGKVLGVMAVGIKPNKLLLDLDELTKNSQQSNYSSLLVQDRSFYRLHMASNDPNINVNDLIGKPVAKEVYEAHAKALIAKTGLTINQLRSFRQTVEYTAINLLGVKTQFSVVYLPHQQLWSMVSRPRALIVDEWKKVMATSLLVFFIVFVILFVLFRSLSRSAEENRQDLLNQANHDFLTGLHNRLFLTYIEHDWTMDKHVRFSVLFIDLDNFKNINDHYGHNIGDKILKVVADRLRSIFTEQDVICRQGGDEFIVLYKKKSDADVEKVAHRVIKGIEEPYHINKYEFVIGASMGISQYPQDGNDFDSLFRAADSAMYVAKEKSLDYQFYTHELSVKTAHTANIDQALHYALQNNELYMVYQPQISANNEFYGVESLVRWESKSLGFIPPDQFIKIAENSGLILDIGHFILRQSISDMARLCRAINCMDIQLSINISVRQFLEIDFLSSLKTILDECQFEPRRLTLEITESIFIDDFDYILPLFQKIRQLGIKLSLDDFGTGFSSLSMLKKLPIDELKIDKSFIDLIVENESDRTMVVNILNIARSLNLKVVAEGIENAEQAKILEQHLCDVQQGYYYSKPVKYSDLVRYCQNK